MRTQGRLSFEYESGDGERVTAWAGLPAVADVMCAFGVPESVKRHVHIRKKSSQFDEPTSVTSFVLMMTAGGDCLDDMNPLREDAALSELLEFKFPSPETARGFLNSFHDDKLVEDARKEVPMGRKAFIPKESEPLRGLAAVNKDLIAAAHKRWPQKRVTVDIDATIHESHKQEAKPHYQQGRGYHPMTAYCPELDLVLWDQFRDGNVPPGMKIGEATLGALDQLPAGIEWIAVRADSAGYDLELLRQLGIRKVHFAIGTDVRKAFRDACGETAGQQWAKIDEREDTLVEVADVDYKPKDWRPSDPKLRFIGIRLTPLQQNLDGEHDRPVRYFGVVTNREELTPVELVRWYWGKGGTIERVHDVVKNDLGGAVLPCGRFGANAAWSRLTLLTYNVLSIVRRLGPTRLATARPKRLRLNLFALPAVLVTHARSLVARLTRTLAGTNDLNVLRDLAWGTSPSS
jgi:hypothetical protein